MQLNETFAKALTSPIGPEAAQFAEVMTLWGLGPVGLAASMAYGAATGGTNGAIADGGGFAAGLAAAEVTAAFLSPAAEFGGPYAVAGLAIAAGIVGLIVATNANSAFRSALTQFEDSAFTQQLKTDFGILGHLISNEAGQDLSGLQNWASNTLSSLARIAGVPGGFGERVRSTPEQSFTQSA